MKKILIMLVMLGFISTISFAAETTKPTVTGNEPVKVEEKKEELGVKKEEKKEEKSEAKKGKKRAHKMNKRSGKKPE